MLKLTEPPKQDFLIETFYSTFNQKRDLTILTSNQKFLRLFMDFQFMEMKKNWKNMKNLIGESHRTFHFNSYFQQSIGSASTSATSSHESRNCRSRELDHHMSSSRYRLRSRSMLNWMKNSELRLNCERIFQSRTQHQQTQTQIHRPTQDNHENQRNLLRSWSKLFVFLFAPSTITKGFQITFFSLLASVVECFVFLRVEMKFWALMICFVSCDHCSLDSRIFEANYSSSEQTKTEKN